MFQSSLFKLGSTVKRLCSFSSGFLSIQLFPFTFVEPSLRGTVHWQASLLSPFPQNDLERQKATYGAPAGTVRKGVIFVISFRKCYTVEFELAVNLCMALFWVFYGAPQVSSHQRFHIIMVDTTAIVWLHCHRSIGASRSLSITNVSHGGRTKG